MSITYIDILIFSIFIVLVFAIYKMLKTDKKVLSVTIVKNASILGTGKIQTLTEKKEENNNEDDLKSFINEIEKQANYNLIFNQLKRMDKSFSLLQFFNEIREFFKTIFSSFYNRDIKNITPQLSCEVLKKFQGEIDTLNKNKQSIIADLVRVKNINIKDIKMNKKKLTVMVEFITEQTAILKDKNDKIIKGDDNKIENIKDFWCITKDYSVKHPMWALEKTIG